MSGLGISCLLKGLFSGSFDTLDQDTVETLILQGFQPIHKVELTWLPSVQYRELMLILAFFLSFISSFSSLV